MKRLFLTGVVGLLGVAGPLGAAAMTGAGAAPAAASPSVALYHMPVIGKHVLPNIVSHLSARFNATSTNWSGYAATTNTFQNVSASWVQPAVTCAQSGGGFLGLGGAPTAYSSFWVGLDGYTSSTVEQTGTDSDCVAGKPTYYAWYEMYPAASVDISTTTYPVAPGDTIAGSVVPSGGTYTLALTDTSTKHANWTYSIPVSTGSTTYARSSAEWVAEAPSTCSLLFCSVTSLANFGTVAFSNASASTAAQPTVSKPISGYVNVPITMTSSSGSVKATPSALTTSGSGSGFSVKWNAS